MNINTIPTSAGSRFFDEKHPDAIPHSGDVSDVSDIDDKNLNTRNNDFLGSTQQHPFSSPIQAAFWANVYRKAKYEGTHRFDPSFQWSEADEKKLVREVRSNLLSLNPITDFKPGRLISELCAGSGLCLLPST